MKRGLTGIVLMAAVILMLSACAGGGSSSGGSYTVSGVVTGLTGTLVLQDNGGDDLGISADGSFTFATAIANGGAYSVTVKTQPAGQTCTASNNSGTIAGANVTNVSVVCSTNAYTVGGTVSGLAGSGLVLQDNGGDDLSITGNGTFTFATPVADGAGYTVTVKTQPANPSQTCTANINTGTIAGANVTNVSVVCSTNAYTVGGTVSGLTGALVLQDNGGDDNIVTSNGPFTFATKVASGANYSVTVRIQPAGQTCLVTGGSGAVGSADVMSVLVACTDNATYTIGGTVSGLVGTGLVLQDNGGDEYTPLNGAFTFLTPVASGLPYAVTVKIQPSNQVCIVTNGSGTVAGANVTNVTITCTTNTYPVGGSVSGLSGGTLVLRDNGGDDTSISTNGTFTFPTNVPVNGNYNVTVSTQPAGQTCSVNSGSGVMPAADVTNVSVVCSTSSFAIGGTVSGLTGTVVLRNNGGDDLTIDQNGSFVFATKVSDSATYSVTVKSSGPTQVCSVASGIGTVSGADVTNISVSCSAVKQRFAYVPHIGSSNCQNQACEVEVYSIDATEGSLTAVGTYPTPTNPYGIALDPTGKFAYVTHINNNRVSAYTVDASTGALSFIASYATGTNPTYAKVDPTGQFLYIVNANGSSLSGYGINGTTGALTELSGSPYGTGSSPGNIAIDPLGKYLYVPNAGSQNISAYSIGAAGVLTPLAGNPFAPIGVSMLRWAVINPAGTILYVVDSPSQSVVHAYAIDGSGGLSKLNDSPSAGYGVYSIAVNPAGTLLYGGNFSTPGTITGFSIDNSGAFSLTTGSPSAATSSPYTVAVDPTGKFLFTTAGGYRAVSVYRIDATTGVLTAVSGTPYTSVSDINDIAVTP